MRSAHPLTATIAAVSLTYACASTRNAPPATSDPSEITYFRVPIQLAADSAIKIARYALGTINGAIREIPNKERVLVSTQYTREGASFHRNITIVASVHRKPVGAQADTTVLELSAWAVDQVEAVRTKTLSGRPIPRLQSNAPIGSVAQDRPYLITATKAPDDWRTMQDVLGAIVALSRPKP